MGLSLAFGDSLEGRALRANGVAREVCASPFAFYLPTNSVNFVMKWRTAF